MKFKDIQVENLTLIHVAMKDFAPNAIFHNGGIEDYLKAVSALNKSSIFYWGITAREAIKQVFIKKQRKFNFSDSELNTLLGGIKEWIKDQPETLQQINDIIGINSSHESLDNTLVKYQLFTIYEGIEFVSDKHDEYWINALYMNLEEILAVNNLEK